LQKITIFLLTLKDGIIYSKTHFKFSKIKIMKLREELEARGLLYQMTDEKLFDIYEKG
jgi:hypothetical protein